MIAPEEINTQILESGEEQSYKIAIDFAKNHYENFPVISFLVPKELRKHIAIIYWFARTADDLADEGNVNSEERINKLNEFELRLTSLLNKNFNNSLEKALYFTITEKKLTPQLFYNLLKAFKQDVTIKRYSSFAELLDYCTNSANPVGRLILELNDIRDEKAFYFSDKICTALQLTNFYQDVSVDYEKGRIYITRDEMEKFGVNEEIFQKKLRDRNFKNLMMYNIEMTEKMFDEGKNLLNYLKGRLKFEINWTILGGEAILQKIKKTEYNVLQNRPKLSKFEFVKLLFKSVI